jgi:hypothetical protein
LELVVGVEFLTFKHFLYAFCWYVVDEVLFDKSVLLLMFMLSGLVCWSRNHLRRWRLGQLEVSSNCSWTDIRGDHMLEFANLFKTIVTVFEEFVFLVRRGMFEVLDN